MAAATATDRAAKIERFVELDALKTVLANLAGVLEETMPNVDLDDAGTFSADMVDELWPTDADFDGAEGLRAQDRSTLKAALICFALADSADFLRGEGERLVQNVERLVSEREGA